MPMTASKPSESSSPGVPSPEVLTSEVLRRVGVPHGFSTRRGGVSGGMFSSFNFGNPGDLDPAERDPAANIRENWRLLARAVGAEHREIVEVHQVHGAECRVVRRGGPSHATPDRRDTKADAIVTDDPARLVAVRVADCVPVLLASDDGHVVASVHAGWRGVVGPMDPSPRVGCGVVDVALAAIADVGIAPGRVVAAIGPCIGATQFEVGPEVASAFAAVFGDWSPLVRPCQKRSLKYFVDLQGAIGEQLRRAGVPAANIDVLRRCTASEPDAFFSHRRDGGRTGRMVGIIGPR